MYAQVFRLRLSMQVFRCLYRYRGMSMAGIRNSYSPIQYTQSKTEAFSLENLVEMTIAGLASAAKRTVNDFLNGYSLKTIVAHIKEHAKSEKDVNHIIHLTVKHAHNLIAKYNLEGKNITFPELIAIKREHPEAPIVSVFTHALAKRNPNLAQFVEIVFDQKQEIKSSVMDNPLMGASPLSKQVVFMDILNLKPVDVYRGTNEADVEALKVRQEQITREQSEVRKQNQNKLANLQIIQKTQQSDPDELARQKYRTNVMVRA